MVTKDNELTESEMKWIEEFKNIISKMPKGIEVVVNNGSVRVFAVGSLSKHIGSKDDGWDIGNYEKYLYSFKNKGNLLPYSEGQ